MVKIKPKIDLVLIEKENLINNNNNDINDKNLKCHYKTRSSIKNINNRNENESEIKEIYSNNSNHNEGGNINKNNINDSNHKELYSIEPSSILSPTSSPTCTPSSYDIIDTNIDYNKLYNSLYTYSIFNTSTFKNILLLKSHNVLDDGYSYLKLKLNKLFLLPENINYSESYRVILSLIMCIFSLLFATCVNVIAHMRFPQNSPPLPDILHDIFPTYLSDPEYAHLPDLFMLLHGILAVYVVLKHTFRIVILRRILVIYSTLMLLRSFCILSTSLPDPCPSCHPACINYRPESLVSHWFLVFAGQFPLTQTCGDFMFSGHTVFLTLVAQLIDFYGGHSKLSIFTWFSTACALCFIIGTRLHYTIDVLIALVLTIGLFRHYHTLSELHSKRASSVDGNKRKPLTSGIFL